MKCFVPVKAASVKGLLAGRLAANRAVVVSVPEGHAVGVLARRVPVIHPEGAGRGVGLQLGPGRGPPAGRVVRIAEPEPAGPRRLGAERRHLRRQLQRAARERVEAGEDRTEGTFRVALDRALPRNGAEGVARGRALGPAVRDEGDAALDEVSRDVVQDGPRAGLPVREVQDVDDNRELAGPGLVTPNDELYLPEGLSRVEGGSWGRGA